MATKLLYLEDFSLYECEAKVTSVSEENGKTVLILDQTVFYPQGGGQPYDMGVIEGSNAVFQVGEVRFVEGVVKHIGAFTSGVFIVDETVHCKIDVPRRELNSRLHSGGHVVDMGVTKLGLGWIPGKGYHFPDGPYVEYAGTLDEQGRDKLKVDLEVACNAYVEEARTTKLVFIPKSEMHTVCHFVPDYLPEGKPARVVMYGDFGVPCGGTHVSNLGEIKQITIRKLKKEGENIRVAYNIER